MTSRVSGRDVEVLVHALETVIAPGPELGGQVGHDLALDVRVEVEQEDEPGPALLRERAQDLVVAHAHVHEPLQALPELLAAAVVYLHQKESLLTHGHILVGRLVRPVAQAIASTAIVATVSARGRVPGMPAVMMAPFSAATAASAGDMTPIAAATAAGMVMLMIVLPAR